MAYGIALGGTSGAGKGEIAEIALGVARERYNSREVKGYDQGVSTSNFLQHSVFSFSHR